MRGKDRDRQTCRQAGRQTDLLGGGGTNGDTGKETGREREFA